MIPFEIDVPYRMRPNMRLLGENEPITYQDQDYDFFIEQKRKIMAQAYGNNWNYNLRYKVLNYLQCNTMEEAILKYQEDFVVFAPDMKDRLSMQMASVCFPSGWDPVSKINKSFAEIHEPVADNEMLIKASNHIATMITQKGPFTRSVWTVTNSPHLVMTRADNQRSWNKEGVENMWYRAERQVTVPLNDFALFFVRTYIVPLSSLDTNKIKESVNTMTDEVLSYKDLHHVKGVLNK